MVSFAFLLAVGVQGLHPPETFRLVTSEQRRVEAVLSYRVICPTIRAREWILFAADAPCLPGQTDVKTTVEPRCNLLQELSPEHRSVWRLRQLGSNPQAASEANLSVTYQALLMSRHLRATDASANADDAPTLNSSERRLHLLAHGSIDHQDRAFRDWLKEKQLVRKKDEEALAFARRTFLQLRQGYRYRYEAKQDRRASKLCSVNCSDCGGLATLFVATLRANGVPARALYGRWARSADPRAKLNGTAYFQWHVKTEFFVDGLGWIPADLSSAIEHDRSPGGLRFFGHDSGDFLTLHIDPDLELNTIHFGRCEVDNLQVPAYWVYGAGSTTGAEIKEDWKVRRLR
jgi:hypothetical protein